MCYSACDLTQYINWTNPPPFERRKNSIVTAVKSTSSEPLACIPSSVMTITCFINLLHKRNMLLACWINVCNMVRKIGSTKYCAGQMWESALICTRTNPWQSQKAQQIGMNTRNMKEPTTKKSNRRVNCGRID